MPRVALLLASAAAVSLLSAAAAMADEPVLQTAKAVGGHVAVTFSLRDDLLPGQIVVAVNGETTPTGAFPRATVRLRERIAASPNSAGLVRYATRKKLRPGTYYVEVSGIEDGGVTDCFPPGSICLEHWSNVRRVVMH